MFDNDLRSGLDVSEVYIIFLFISAYESSELLKFLHKFGKSIYKLLLPSEMEFMDFSILLRFCSLFSDDSVLDLKDFLESLRNHDQITFETFELAVYKCFKDIDEKPKAKRIWTSNDDDSQQRQYIESPYNPKEYNAFSSHKEKCVLI